MAQVLLFFKIKNAKECNMSKLFSMNTKKIIIITAFALVSLMPAFTEEIAPPEHNSADFIWLLIAGFLVFFMQAGFAMVETGLTRAKNAGNIIMKNLMDFAVGSIAFFFIGWGLMYGSSKLGGFIGFSDFGLTSATPENNSGLWQYAMWFFQVVFAATAATIVSGAMAERTKFIAYLIYSFVISAFIYPVSGHWAWGGGWLSKLGFHDFAGSTVVHSVGGWAALVGALMLGPRIGKYDSNGKSKAIQGHSITLAALGVFILWFGWFGFNPGSTLAFADNIGHIAMTTNLAAAAGAVFAMITIWLISKKPDVSMTLNGALAGLVAITAPCAVVSPLSAVIIGAIAGVLVVISVLFIDKVLKIDDPVGAISVHMVCGVFGTLAVGLFGEAKYNGGVAVGLFFGGGIRQLAIQALGVVSVAIWVIITASILFTILKFTVGLRVSREEELKGLDIDEHGMEAYSGFQILD